MAQPPTEHTVASTYNEPPEHEQSAGERTAADTEMDALTAFAELARIDLGTNDLQQVLARVAELAAAVIPAVDEASVTLVAQGTAGTVAFTGSMAIELDETQYEAGYGPCLDAARDGAIYMVSDTAVDDRWPRFAAAAVEHGVRSSLSVGIPVQQSLTGALNLYSVRTTAFDENDLSLAETFAGYAAVAIANAHLYASTASLAKQMSDAMNSRAVIEQAKGILIAQQNVGPDEAFAILARASQAGNRKLRDIAQAIV